MTTKSKTCPNCGAKITCGCQKRIATDGRQCCSKCVVLLNARILKQKRNQVL